MLNKSNWYNKAFFRSFCSSWNMPVYKQVYDWLEPDSVVIDVGCGSGELLLKCAEKIKQGIGLELTADLIQQAISKLAPRNTEKISFRQKDFLNWEENQKIDTITFIFVLHEIEPVKRKTILHKALSLADNVIIADYQTPQPINPAGMLNWLAEMLTSKAHFNNFKQYSKTRWLDNFVRENQFTVGESHTLYSGSYQLLKLCR